MGESQGEPLTQAMKAGGSLGMRLGQRGMLTLLLVMQLKMGTQPFPKARDWRKCDKVFQFVGKLLLQFLHYFPY